MRDFFLLMVIVGFLFVNPAIVSAQAERQHMLTSEEIGIPISHTEFKNLVKKTATTMPDVKGIKISTLIKLIRIENTLEFNEITEATEANKRFSSLFVKNNYRGSFKKKMGAIEGIGGSLYSKKYKIFLGGLPDSNSKFRLVKQ
jgi:hypothetical protein